MEAVGAVASFIAIGQALAGIPKLVKIIQDIANTREELNELLFEVRVRILWARCCRKLSTTAVGNLHRATR